MYGLIQLDPMTTDIKTVVVDLGTNSCKIGFSGDSAPKKDIPSVISDVSKYTRVIYQDDSHWDYIGEGALKMMPLHEIKNFITNGEIINFDNYSKLFNSFLKILNLSNKLEEIQHFTTEPLFASDRQREKLSQITFEDFGMHSFYTVVQARAAALSTGKTTGMFIDIGEGQRHIYSMNDGVCIRRVISRKNFGGGIVTDTLMRKLNEIGYQFYGNNQREIVKQIKENHIYTPMDCNDALYSNKKEISYELPDGNLIQIPMEMLITCGEIFFDPSYSNNEYNSIHQESFDLIQKCDLKTQNTLLNSIHLFGGPTLNKGFHERFEKEIQILAGKDQSTKVIASTDRKYSTWIGSSMMSNLSSFQNKWFKKDEYEEHGPFLVHKKCPRF